MLPKSTSNGSSIHINPRFRNVHINPHFINKANASGEAAMPTYQHPPTIHINPRFINAQNMAPVQQTSPIVLADTSGSVPPKTQIDHQLLSTNNVDDGGGASGGSNQGVYANAEPLADTKIHPRTKIINNSRTTSTSSKALTTSPIPKSAVNSAKSLIRIGSKKLVRPVERKVVTASKSSGSKAIATLRRPVQTKYKIVKEQSTFKIDRRSQLAKQKALLARKTAKINSIRMPCINESLVPRKTVKCSLHAESQKSTTFLNINGILYKTNHRKWEKTQPTKSSKSIDAAKQTNYRRVTVRGENFLLDASGRHLVRDAAPATVKPTPSPSATKSIKRIDIGKITFVRKANGTYERTDYHKNRYHLNVAKQRSIQMLTNGLVKSNVPCAIYRKLGKCAAYERGKCTKLHDNKLVDICPGFLKGSCDKTDCLLLHKTSLSKMPICKFYLNGLCTKDDCPYLHRKFNADTELCADFLKGYCEKAEECTKRHEFVNRNDSTKKSKKVVRTPKKERANKTTETTTNPATTTSNSINESVEECAKNSGSRYYDNEQSNNVDNTGNTTIPPPQPPSTSPTTTTTTLVDQKNVLESPNIPRKKRIGALPSFIPLG